ncbi:MAG: hypothetical protein CMD25_09600 [Flavobacteriales bacterium]|jgi:hypothetical protein|nr:hypothetical protein [Flavobacteriales bacterium]|tara:strand:+ start:129 stop:563 length:435 start_codon:yes stop_codon:yes gene_type:complete
MSKVKGLFDHVKQITNVQSPTYWDTLSEGDKKTWSNYMIHRFLSMKSEWIQLVNEVQKYWELAPKNVYQFYIDVLPRGRTFLKYTKSKHKSKVNPWVMEHLTDYFECSSKEVDDYLEILTPQQVKTIIMKYGVDDKQLKTIWSK